jgi:glycosyltransferase involved in cell wall biosynthesis
LPVYNGERYLEAALQSLLAQTYRDFEIIITDNASTDRTQQICRRFADADQRIRYIRHAQNIGAARNFNSGFAAARGEYFKWCAHDDLISTSFIEESVRALDSTPGDVLVYGRQQGIDEEQRLTPWVSCTPPALQGKSAAARFGTVYRLQGFDAAIFGLIRRESLAQTSLHQSYYGSDIALLAELALLGSFALIPHITFYNREHASRSINIADKRQRQAWHDPAHITRPLPEHVNLLRHLLGIATRHRDKAPVYRTMCGLLAWAATPIQLSRYALDVVGVVSPPLQRQLRTRGWQALRAVTRVGAASRSS